MSLTDIEVNNIRAGLEHVVNLLSKLGEVSREDGGSNEVVLVAPDIQRSGSAVVRRNRREGRRRGEGRGGEDGTELHVDRDVVEGGLESVSRWLFSLFPRTGGQSSRADDDDDRLCKVRAWLHTVRYRFIKKFPE